jgi:peptide deformylase
MKLPLRYYNDSVLRKKALPIEEITPEIIQLAQEMIETMIAWNGVGLAAPQIGQLVRMFVIRDERVTVDGQVILGPPEVLINPQLSNPSTEKVPMTEGCLSLPGLYMEVVRPKSIHVRYQTLEGKWVEETLDNFRARVTMHENDHLNGVLIIDRIDRAERKKLDERLAAMDKKYHK